MSHKTVSVEDEDFLEVDPEIRGQKFVCLSFLSPENVLPLKEHFMTRNFLHDFELDFKATAFRDFLHTLITKQQELSDRLIVELKKIAPESMHENIDLVSRVLRPRIDPIFTDLETLLQTKAAEIRTTNVKKAWDDYMFANRKRLEEEFFKSQDFHTTVRGVKVRGVYDTKNEADAQCKILRRRDKSFHVFVGQVGYWLPWDPTANEIQDQEYMESELNTLASKYQENEANREELYEAEKRERVTTAKREAKRAKEAVGMGATTAAPPTPSIDSGSIPEIKSNGLTGTDAVMSESDILSMFETQGDNVLARKEEGPDAKIV